MMELPKRVEDMVLSLTLETHVKASLEATFASLLEEMGPGFETNEGRSLQMKIEAWPGGRWYRDLGDGNGHLWAHVQAIKRPTLLEFYGPLMMSYAVASNVQYRLTEEKGGTLITLRHTALGFIEEQHRKGISSGWGHHLDRVKKLAEASPSRAAAGSQAK